MRRGTVLVLSVSVGLVLADSAIVTLALPAILRELDSSVSQVAWVLIAFNLVLALAAVPAALVCHRRDPAEVCVGGALLLAAATGTCAGATDMNVLIVARGVQAIGGALVIVSCLSLLVIATGSEQLGIRRWTAAGVVGAAAGPVAGGLLTAAFSWQSIFIVQLPLLLAVVPVALVLRAPASEPEHRPRDRPDLMGNVSLALLSAALTAALFLLVLLLVEGWRRSPAVAALTVTVVPLAAFLAAPLARRARAGTTAEIAAGCLLVSGGLAALALLPRAELGWTLAPQGLIGLGLGLTVDSMTSSALAGRFPLSLHGGWTIAARHAGVVLGLAILTPVFTADLRTARAPAQEAIAGLVLDAPLSATAKIDLAEGLGRQLQAESGRVPDLHPAFAALQVPVAQRPAAHLLERHLDDQLERAATRAFRDAFLIAAALALSALGSLIPWSRKAPL